MPSTLSEVRADCKTTFSSKPACFQATLQNEPHTLKLTPPYTPNPKLSGLGLGRGNSFSGIDVGGPVKLAVLGFIRIVYGSWSRTMRYLFNKSMPVYSAAVGLVGAGLRIEGAWLWLLPTYLPRSPPRKEHERRESKGMIVTMALNIELSI